MGYNLTELERFFYERLIDETVFNDLTEEELEEAMGTWINDNFEPCDETGLYYSL